MCPIQYGYSKNCFKMNVLKKMVYLHGHNYNSSNAMQVTTIENEIIQEKWNATVSYHYFYWL